MEYFLDYQYLGITTIVAVIAFFALRKLGERLAEDLYGGIKRLLAAVLSGIRWLFGRKPRKDISPSPAAAGVQPAASIASDPPPAPPPTRTPPTPVRPKSSGPPEIRTPAGRVHGLEWLADGDESKLYAASLEPADAGETRAVVVKLPTSDAASDHLREEAATLQALGVEAKQYAKHLPQVLTRFRLADRRLALVLKRLDGLTLAQLRERFSDGIEPRHLVWIFRRTLSLLGYVHSQGVLHGNITPDHILVRPADHNVWLLDWTRSVSNPRASGQHFRIVHPVYGPPEAHQRRPALPSSDLYSLALCMVHGLGGQPGERKPPPQTPPALARLIRALLKESPIQRPQDAWALYNELEKIRDDLFGPHRFVELVVDN